MQGEGSREDGRCTGATLTMPSRNTGQSREGEQNTVTPPRRTKKRNKDAWMTRGVARQLGTIDFARIQAATTPVTSGAGFELLCSYNWSPQPNPTIYVPGKHNPVHLSTGFVRA
jgi:hypothetical protein